MRDWRAKVVGYRDYESDGKDWLVNNPFVRKYEDLERQFDALQARGGGDRPEDLLDALHLLATTESTGQQDPEDRQKWRDIHDAARVVIIFTDAPFHKTLRIPEAEGADVGIVKQECMSSRLILSIFAPEDDDDGFYDLSEIPHSSYTAASGDSLGSITKDSEAFSELMKQLAKSVSQSASVLQ